jgi:hypothetical protein
MKTPPSPCSAAISSTKYFGLEAGYVDFGKIEAEVTDAALEGDSAYLTAVGTLPITEKFSAYAKAGLHRWNVDTSLPGLTGSDDDSGTDPTYGVGAQYRFTTTSRYAANTAASRSKMRMRIWRSCRSLRLLIAVGQCNRTTPLESPAAFFLFVSF